MLFYCFISAWLYMGVNTLRISIMISLGSREEVVFILHVKRRDRGFTWSSFTLLLKNTQPTSKVSVFLSVFLSLCCSSNKVLEDTTS